MRTAEDMTMSETSAPAFDPMNGGCPHCRWEETNLGRVLDKKCDLHQKIEDMQVDRAMDRQIADSLNRMLRNTIRALGGDETDDPVNLATARMEEIAGLEALEPVPDPCLAMAREALADAARDVFAERERQVEVEGWTPGHDDQHTDGELAKAAGCYAWIAAQSDDLRGIFANPPPTWPAEWSAEWWKPTNRRRDLVKAAALIIAEIERLDRAALSALEEGK